MFFLSKNHETSAFHIHQGLEESCIKRLLLGVAFAANAGSVLLPISSTTTLITLSNWAVRAVSASMTLLCVCCFLGKWTWSLIFMFHSDLYFSCILRWSLPSKVDDMHCGMVYSFHCAKLLSFLCGPHQLSPQIARLIEGLRPSTLPMELDIRLWTCGTVPLWNFCQTFPSFHLQWL